jgi:hypothetical protein
VVSHYAQVALSFTINGVPDVHESFRLWLVNRNNFTNKRGVQSQLLVGHNRCAFDVLEIITNPQLASLKPYFERYIAILEAVLSRYMIERLAAPAK